MSSFSWTLPASGAAASTEPLDARRKLFGKDLDWRQGRLSTTGAGDWLTVEGVDALHQSVLRRLSTRPNGWATRPGYGVGVEEFIEEEMTQSTFNELVSRIKISLAKDPRIDEVAAVRYAESGEMVILRVSIKVKGQALTLPDFRFREAA